MDGYILPWIASHHCLSPCTLTSHRYTRSSPFPLTLFCTTVYFWLVENAKWFKAQSEREPHYFEVLLCHFRTRPHLVHDRACDTTNLLPQQSQSVWRFRGIIPYQRRRLSWNSSLEISVSLRCWEIAVIHAPFFVARQRRFNPALFVGSFLLVSTSISENYRFLCVSALDLRTQDLFPG